MSQAEFVEASDTNVRSGYVSGAMILDTNYTSARAAHLDRLKYAGAVNYNASNVITQEAELVDFNPGARYYTVPAGSSLIIQSISFTVVPEDSAGTNLWARFFISGSSDKCLFGFNSPSGCGDFGNGPELCYTNNVPFPNGLRIPTGSIIGLGVRYDDRLGNDNVDVGIAFRGFLMKD